MATTLQRRTTGTCPVCGGPAEGLDVKYSFFRMTEHGTFGPAPLDDLPRVHAYEEKIERFSDKDVITVQPCGDSFPRHQYAGWMREVEERQEAARVEAAKRKHDRGPEGLIERIETALIGRSTATAEAVRAAIEEWRNQP